VDLRFQILYSRNKLRGRPFVVVGVCRRTAGCHARLTSDYFAARYSGEAVERSRRVEERPENMYKV
jgi:hypothetical protein